MTFYPDPDPATRHALTHPRDERAPPHHLRCTHVEGDERCKLGGGHQGAHELLPPKVSP
jgi:hypothetical protein